MASNYIRFPDWEDRLRTYLDRVSEDSFKWGSHDCALFTAGAVMAMTSDDPALVMRNTYTDELGARTALRERGAGTLLKTVRSIFKSKPVAQAHRGDVVMLDATTCGISVGQFSWFTGQDSTREGLVHLPTLSCAYAFEVPYADGAA